MWQVIWKINTNIIQISSIIYLYLIHNTWCKKYHNKILYYEGTHKNINLYLTYFTNILIILMFEDILMPTMYVPSMTRRDDMGIRLMECILIQG